MSESLVDHIYEAALIPERWPGALEGMNRISNSRSNSLFVFSDRFSPRGISTDITSDLIEPFLQSDAWRMSPSVRWTLATRPSAFSSVDDVMSVEEAAADEVWAPLVARGFGQRLATVIPLHSGDQATFVLARMREHGRYTPLEVAALNGLRPHLHRAMFISARLGLERAQTMTEALSRLGLAAAVIDQTGRVIGSNSLLQNLHSVFLPTAHGRIAMHDRSRNHLLRQGLGRIHDRSLGGAGFSIPVPAATDRSHPPLLIHLLPVRGMAEDIFTGGQALLVVSLFKRRAAPSPELLHGLFDLSPAEARLVGELASGMTPREITAARKISMPTLRTQIRSVLAKTGLPRMAELTQLLAQRPTPGEDAGLPDDD